MEEKVHFVHQGEGVDSKGNKTQVATEFRGKGLIRTSVVRATGNKEQDEEKALRALDSPDISADDLLRKVNGDS